MPWGEEELEKNCQFYFFFVPVTSLLSDGVFVLTQVARGESSSPPVPPQCPSRYRVEISLVMDNLVEGEVRAQVGSFQHLRKTYTHVHPFLNYPCSYRQIHQKESLQFHWDVLNMQNPLLFALLFFKWETWVSKTSKYRFRGYIRFQFLRANRQMFDFPSLFTIWSG